MRVEVRSAILSNPGATMTVTGCTLSGNAAIGAAGGDGDNQLWLRAGRRDQRFRELDRSQFDAHRQPGPGHAPGPRRRPITDCLERQCDRRRRHLLPRRLSVPAAAATVADSTLAGNQAVGGAGGGAGSAGSVGEGGGISLIAVPSALVDRLYAR